MNKLKAQNSQFEVLSVVIIAKNEQKMIGECLEGVKWADEIILVDSGSTDKTIEVARKIIPKIKIVETEKGSFSDWRNRGLKNVHGAWVLYIDADERVSIDLQREIKEVIENNNYDYFIMPRLNNLLGKDMRHGGWYPDYVTRLFKKDKISHWQGKIHESPVVKGRKGQLKNELNHMTHHNLSDMVLKSLKWAHLEAEQFYEKKSPAVSWRHLLILPLKELIRRIIFLRGFQDGIVGFIEGVMQAFNKFLVFAYLWEMQRKNENH